MSILLDPSARPVVAHRGNAAHAPENTLESLRAGVATGSDALEFDVRITRDGHAVLMHDADVARTTTGTGAVRGLSLGEVRTFDAGARFTRDGGRTFPWAGKGVRVPLLDEVLEEFASLPLILEVKAADAAEAVERSIRHHSATARVLVGSFVHEALARFRGSDIANGASRRDVIRLYARAALHGRPSRVPFRALCIPQREGILPLPVRRFARMLKPLGVPTHIWTVDDPCEAVRLRGSGVNAIISNDPAAILAAFGRRPVDVTLSPPMA